MTSIGKGTIYLMISNIIFLGSGYILHIGLGRVLGPKDYGLFGIIMAIITFISIAMKTGIPYAASKFISENNRDNQTDIIINKTIKLQLIFGISIFFLYILLSDKIADIFNDKELMIYIKLSSIAILTYTVFSLYTGILNGFKYYRKQAETFAIYSIMKVGCVFLFMALGFGLYGVIIGVILAPIIGSIGIVKCLKYVKTDVEKSKSVENFENFETKKLIYFAIPVTIFSIGYNLLGSLDLFLVKSILLGNDYTGYYTASTNISRVPTFILLGLSTAIFPVISNSISNNDSRLTTDYIRISLRYMIMFILPITFIISATSKELISLLYSMKYIPATESLEILIFGWASLAIFQLLTTILNAGSYQKISLYIVIFSLIISFLLNINLIPIYGLRGAAFATTFTGIFAIILSGIYVHKLYNVSIDKYSILKILGTSLLIYLLAKIIEKKIFLPIEYVILFGIYIGILFILKEFKKEDIEVFKKIIKLKKKILKYLKKS